MECIMIEMVIHYALLHFKYTPVKIQYLQG